jgi:hypothetical protein
LRTPHLEKSEMSRLYVSSSLSVVSGRIWQDASVNGSTCRSSAKIGDPRKPSGFRSLAAIVSRVVGGPWYLCVSIPLLLPKVHCTSETGNSQRSSQKRLSVPVTIMRQHLLFTTKLDTRDAMLTYHHNLVTSLPPPVKTQ